MLTYKQLLNRAYKYAEKYGEDITNLYFGDYICYGIKGNVMLKRIANGDYCKDWKDIAIENSADGLSIMIIGIRKDGLKLEIAHHDYIF